MKAVKTDKTWKSNSLRLKLRAAEVTCDESAAKELLMQEIKTDEGELLASYSKPLEIQAVADV